MLCGKEKEAARDGSGTTQSNRFFKRDRRKPQQWNTVRQSSEHMEILKSSSAVTLLMHFDYNIKRVANVWEASVRPFCRDSPRTERDEILKA